MAHIVSRTGIGKVSPAAPLFLDVGGPASFDAYVTMLSDVTINGLLSVQRSSNIASLEFRVPSDAEPQFVIWRDGSISWGAGGASPTDCNLHREDVLVLRTNSSLKVDIDLWVSSDLYVNGNTTLGDDSSSDTTSFSSRISSDFIPASNNSFDIGSVSLGWRDLFIYRNATFGTTSSDTIFFNSRVSSNFIPSVDNFSTLGSLTRRWASVFISGTLRNDGSTILGNDATDLISLNGSVNTDILPQNDNTNDIGSASNKWRSLYLGSDLFVDGSSTLGNSASETVTFNAQIVNDLIPNSDNAFDLGSALARWGSLFLGSGITADGPSFFNGDVTVGDTSSDTVFFNAYIGSDLIPSQDNVFNIGNSLSRWDSVHAGPNGFTVHNDNTDTSKVTLGFTGSTASLQTDASTDLRMATGVNAGIVVDVDGKVGINTSSALSYNLEIDGSVGASETISGMKSSGTSLYAESNLVVKGSVEAESTSKSLNIGITEDTEFINIGTGEGLQTLNIGTGTGPTVINIGSAGDIINISGTANYTQTINSAVLDKTFVLNAGGANLTTPNSGIFVEQAAEILLSVDDAVWQTGNIVRYYMADTGNISEGNTLTITGFSDARNNGSFNVVGVSPGTYVDVNNPFRNSPSGNELGASASSTNPELPAYIKLSADASAWELVSTAYPTNQFSFKNSGGDVSFEVDAASLIISSPGAVLPGVSGDDLGSLTSRWDIFSGSIESQSVTVADLLRVNGNTILGDLNSDTVTVNAVISFLGRINSSLVPSSPLLNIGLSTDRWEDLWLNGSIDADGSADIGLNLTVGGSLLANGDVNLGEDSSDTISFYGLVGTDIIPASPSSSVLGSDLNPWQNIYTDSLTIPTLNQGSVLFAGVDGVISEDSTNFVWDSSSSFLGLGTSSPTARLHVASASGGVGVKLTNDNSTAGLGFFGDSVSRVQYSGTSLSFSYTSHANLASSSSGTNNLTLLSSGISLFGGGVGHSVGTLVASNTYTVQASDTVILVDSSSASITANCTISLPSASARRMLVIKDAGNNCYATNKSIVLQPASGEYVEFQAADVSYIMDVDGMSLMLHSDGIGRWYII